MIYAIVGFGIVCVVASRLIYKRWITLHINDLVSLREKLLEMDGAERDDYIEEIDVLLSKKYI